MNRLSIMIVMLATLLSATSCTTCRAPVVEKIARQRVEAIAVPEDSARVTIRITPTPEGTVEIRGIEQRTTPRADVRVTATDSTIDVLAIVHPDTIFVAVSDSLIRETPAPMTATDRFFEKFDATLWLIVIVLALILIMRVLTLTKQ